MKFEDIQSEIDNILELDGAELTDEQKQAVDEYLDALALQEADAVDGLCRYIRHLAAEAKAQREEARRLAASAASKENSLNYLKAGLLVSMRRRGIEKVKGNAYKASIRKTPVVQIDDEDALPDEYKRTTVTVAPDKIAIRDALKIGATVPGARMATSETLQVA